MGSLFVLSKEVIYFLILSQWNFSFDLGISALVSHKGRVVLLLMIRIKPSKDWRDFKIVSCLREFRISSPEERDAI